MIKSTLPNLRKTTRHLKTCADFTPEEMHQIFAVAQRFKSNPKEFANCLKNKTMLMFFEKPSLRTRVSFETGMNLMGGHAIYYNIKDSPLGAKENVYDTISCLNEYVDVVMARVMKKKTIDDLAKDAQIPVINGLDDNGHPTQIISDMFSILEAKGTIRGLTITYMGDCENNVTYDLMRAGTKLGANIRVCGPSEGQFQMKKENVDECLGYCKKYGGSLKIFHDPKAAVKDADVVYTDSWMSYHIKPEQLKKRLQTLHPYKVTSELMKLAKPDAIFMNCLPADRSMEQTADVIDSKQSIVFTQAGNRLYGHMAITLFLMGLVPKQLGENRILCALGGNALIKPGQKGTYQEQLHNAKVASSELAKLVARGYKLALTHGNGPQVGHLYLQNEALKKKIPQQPLYANGAMSQGFIGFVMQNTLQLELYKQLTNKVCSTVITQSIVDGHDPAFKRPTKPVGRFYTAKEAEEIRKEGYTVKEDSGRGYRIVVASPEPKKIVEIETIRTLYENGHIPICCGGGGIPVVEDGNGGYNGVDAVIDKDLCAEVLASKLSVDKFVILTDVEGVYKNYKKQNQELIRSITVAEAKKMLAEKQFGEGSMAPKMLAAMRFVEKTGKNAIITSLEKCVDAVDGKCGTVIRP